MYNPNPSCSRFKLKLQKSNSRKQMNNIFEHGIVPERNFFTTLHVEYLAVMKTDRSFDIDMQSTYLRIIYKSNLVKIYKLVN